MGNPEKTIKLAHAARAPSILRRGNARQTFS